MAAQARVLERGQARQEDRSGFALVARQRERTLEDVTGRQDAELIAQLAGAPAAVEHRDHGIHAQPRVVLQAAEHPRKTRAPAETTDGQLAQAHGSLYRDLVSCYDRPVKDALDILASDLRAIFGARLRMLAVYGAHARAAGASLAGLPTPAKGEPIATLVLLDAAVGYDDLVACGQKTSSWTSLELATPLLLGLDEFTRSLDAFPLEYGDIIVHHLLVLGEDVLAQVRIDPADVRRACEVQAKSHLIHLREGFMQAGGSASEIARLVSVSARPFATLLEQVERLLAVSGPGLATSAGLRPDVVTRVLAIARGERLSSDEALRLIPDYVEVVAQLWRYVDAWRR